MRQTGTLPCWEYQPWGREVCYKGPLFSIIPCFGILKIFSTQKIQSSKGIAVYLLINQKTWMSMSFFCCFYFFCLFFKFRLNKVPFLFYGNFIIKTINTKYFFGKKDVLDTQLLFVSVLFLLYLYSTQFNCLQSMVILSHFFIPTNYGHLLQHKTQTIKKITKTNFHPQNEHIKIYTARPSE